MRDYVFCNGNIREGKELDNKNSSIIYLGRFYWIDEAIDYAKVMGLYE